MLGKGQGDVAGKMIDVYFEVFGDVLGRLPEKEDGESAGEEEKEEKQKKEKGQKRKRNDKSDNGVTQAAPAGVGEMDSKLVAAVLTGINRAFPFATIDDEACVSCSHPSSCSVSDSPSDLLEQVQAATRYTIPNHAHWNF
jgi:ribosome biogenesis protein MAK21